MQLFFSHNFFPDPGVNFTNIFRASLVQKNTILKCKHKRPQEKLSEEKAASKMFVKLTANFTNLMAQMRR
jgi:hypothetical protein